MLVTTYVVQRDDRGAAPLQSAAPSPVTPSAPATPAAQPTRATRAPGVGAGGALGLAVAPISLRYTFDSGPGRPVTDAAAEFPLRVLTQAGGQLRFAAVEDPTGLVPDAVTAPLLASGLAMQFPRRCDRPAEQCPRVILEGARDDALNPGTRPLQYGASIRMNPADTGDGANVLQKGYSVGGGSQFKLQVDHEAGRPSCVIADGSRIYRVEPVTGVADGAWHTIVCTRNDSRLGITVDGVAAGSVFVPPEVSIATPEPLRIGGKGANPGNDQFAGQIDNVFLTIS